MSIAIILYLLVLALLPQPLMWVQWHLDPTIKKAYALPPYRQDQLAGPSRAYHQHIINHAYLSLLGVMLFDYNIIAGSIGLALSVGYPMLIEFFVDPILRKKPTNQIDWRERLLGALAPIPLLGIKLIGGLYGL